MTPNAAAIALTLLAASVSVVTAAVAQDARPAPPAAPAKGMECPTGEATKPNEAKATPGQNPAPDQKAAVPAEQSAILPNAGGHVNSAPGNIQQSGDPIPSSLDCNLPADHPNALKPGAVQADMPPQSK